MNRAALAADVEGLAFLVLNNLNHAGITGEAARGLQGQGRAILMLAAACAAVTQGLSINMHDDLMTITAAQRLSAMRQKAFGDPS